MKRAISFTIFILFASIMFYSGCKDTINASDINKVIIPSSNVSYSKYIQPVLNVYCATSGCHDGTNPDAYSFTSWGNLRGAPDAVFPTSPETSHLVWIIEGRAGINHPFLYYNLNANQIQGVKTWITEGANNN